MCYVCGTDEINQLCFVWMSVMNAKNIILFPGSTGLWGMKNDKAFLIKINENSSNLFLGHFNSMPFEGPGKTGNW